MPKQIAPTPIHTFDRLIKGVMLSRYKRFFADVRLEDGSIVTAHVPNTGSMRGCWDKHWPCLLSYHDEAHRKLKYTLEFTHNGLSWIGVNTSMTNKLVKAALEHKLIPELSSFAQIQPEYKIGDSRLDFLLQSAKGEQSFVEVKNVTLKEEKSSRALFPDAKTTRGQKHVQELTQLQSLGHKTFMFFAVQRSDVDCFSIAKSIDPEYFRLLKEAHDLGVEILVYQFVLDQNSVVLQRPIPYTL